MTARLASLPSRLLESSPLRHVPFRLFYFGSIGTALGYTMQTTVAAWLMATLTPSAFMVALVQTASTAPALLFGLAAGTAMGASRAGSAWRFREYFHRCDERPAVCLTFAGDGVAGQPELALQFVRKRTLGVVARDRARSACARPGRFWIALRGIRRRR